MSTRGVLSLLDRGGRDLVHIILARAQIHSIDGETGESAADILACYRFAEHFAGPKPLDYQLLRVTIKQRTLRVASRILMRAEVTEGYLDELQGGLGELLQREGTPIDFSGERLLCHLFISETFTDDGTGEGQVPRAIIDSLVDTAPTTMDNGSPVQAGASAWRELRRGETARLADEVFAYLDSVAGRTPFELSRSGMSVEDTLRALCGNNVFLRQLAPAYAKAYYVGYRQQAFARAFIVVMAVMQYQLEHGYLPSRLDQLVRDAYLGALPIDPFSGASFVYHALDTGFILYSFGPDFDDDGAIGGENQNGTLDGDDVFWPPVYR
jgi:hypothetical protein